ncbi:bifunctional lysylphosphatidylglycerol flippase/synthetase MprF [Ligilactobacillus ceti]|uniref:Phosphatidylglycerol lysyltransferase n=1 Tax=Ligilactobacillus ceti DSM 22408 TaxID=1122146 RepID=A0A0R2KLY2_9LACO|nr:bifunctional lysylphosphatidylglycerol flippase/synthetase MprF [Ligilactobacillus ceti]KRN88469.1 hypothetical protein IV53_GL000433 [Ligilactobacillus ceti DSM 22408]
MKNIINQIKTFVQEKATILKIIFVISVLIFVIFEVGRVFHDIDWAKVGEGLADQPPLSVILMLVLGLVAASPMLIYDFTIIQFLPGKYSIPYIIRSGWITNSYTNIAGFGGILGASLRAHFYKKNASKKQILYALSKIALFLIAGLSILCWVSLIMIFGLHIATDFSRYWIWLLGGGLYFPILFTLTKFKNNEFFQDLTLKKEIALILGSLLEWAFAGGFFVVIGYIMHIHVQLSAVFPIYIIASVIGIVSMVPGGLGSFDVFMIVGLTGLGVNSEIAVVWLLFFRIFYYIVPFVIGTVFFAHEMGSQINEFFDGIPKSILQKTAHVIVTVFMYISGIFLLLEAAVPNFVFSNSFLMKIYPYTLFFLHQTTNIVFAVLLIGMARAIHAKVQRAFWPTLVILMVGVVNTLVATYTPVLAGFLIVVMICVILARKELYRKQLRYSVNEMILDGSIFITTFIIYVIIGVINSPKYLKTHRIPDGLLFPGQKIWLSGFMGLLIASVVVAVLIKYFAESRDPFKYSNYSNDRLDRILAKYPGNEVSHLAYLRDKNIYFYTVDGEDKLFYMYRRVADKLIIMGEPVGDSAYQEESLIEFMEKADMYNYELVFYEVDRDFTMLLHEYGYDFIKMGEEGYVELADFTLQGKKRRAQRALMNKFEREGYTFEIVQPPFSTEFMQEMKEVSDSWLNGQVEKGFSLGFFDEEYLNKAPLAIVNDSEGKLVAFANFMPMDGKEVLSIDLMRHSKEAPSGIMDKIFISLFEYGRDEGYKYFNMGMAPLSNVGQSRYSFIEEQVAHFIYEYGYRLYAFQGLRAYKNKYVTKWFSKYTAYRKRSSIIVTMLELVYVVNQKSDKSSFVKDKKKPIFLRIIE